MENKLQFSQTQGLLAVLILVMIAAPLYYAKRHTDYYTRRTWTRYPRTLISEEYERLQTGDLILFAPLVPIPIISAAMLHEMTHVGMVIRAASKSTHDERAASKSTHDECADLEFAQCLLAETGGGVPPGTIPGYELDAGVVISPLLARLKTYPGCFYLMKLAQPLSAAAASAIATEAAACVGEPYPSNLEIAESLLARKPVRHCYGFVSDLLAAAGAAHIDRHAGSPLLTVCDEVLALAGPGKLYEPIHELLYDIDANCKLTKL